MELEPALAEDVSRWAEPRSHPVRRLQLDHPESLSAPVSDLHRRWAATRDTEDRLLVESFALLDPFHVARAGAAKYWTLFPVQGSAEGASRYLDSCAHFSVIDALLFNHGVRSAGLADTQSWQQIVDRGARPGHLLGVRAGAFPADFASFARYGPALRRLPTADQPPGTTSPKYRSHNWSPWPPLELSPPPYPPERRVPSRDGPERRRTPDRGNQRRGP
jgi:hypothetical protein